MARAAGLLFVAAAVAVYSCRGSASDDAGVRVGASIGYSSDRHPGVDGSGGDGRSGAAGAADPAAGVLAGDLGIGVDPVTPAPGGAPPVLDDPAAADTAPDDGPDPDSDPADAPSPLPASPSTGPPTAVDLVVEGVTVPATAEPAVDGCGDPVTFAADHLVDGDDATAWRMPGDGTGRSLTLALEGERRVLSVGLVPGYDDVDGCDGTDRFAQNRRIAEVTWEFDDGQRVRQRFLSVATLQRVDVDATTRTIVVHIEGVSADPERDFTPVAEIAVRGI